MPEKAGSRPKRNFEIPDYQRATNTENGKRVLQALGRLGGEGNFAQIESQSKVQGPTSVHHLYSMIQYGVLVKVSRGTYRLRFKSPVCFISSNWGSKYNRQTSFAYMGLLGRSSDREEPETLASINLLRKEGIEPRIRYVATSFSAVSDWSRKELDCQWILCADEEIANISSLKKRVVPVLENLLQDHIVLLDCTSATKPATISFYQLAQEYLAPLVYVYEEQHKLEWLISRNDLAHRLGFERESNASFY